MSVRVALVLWLWRMAPRTLAVEPRLLPHSYITSTSLRTRCVAPQTIENLDEQLNKGVSHEIKKRN